MARRLGGAEQLTAAISISYGIDEDMQGDSQDPAWPMLNQNVDEAFREAAAIGLPVFVSSGDQRSGSQRGFVGQDEVTALSSSAHVAYPASSTYATAVGGTMLYGQNGRSPRRWSGPNWGIRGKANIRT